MSIYPNLRVLLPGLMAFLVFLITGCSETTEDDKELETNAWLTLPTIIEGSTGQKNYDIKFFLGKPLEKDVSIEYSVQDISATSLEDYNLPSGKVVFPSGVRSVSVPITIMGDILEEENEALRITLSAPKHITLRQKTYVIDIPNDDELPVVSLSSLATVQEGDVNKNYTVRIGLSYAYSQPITLTLETKSSTATTDDYELISNKVVIPANTKTFDADIITIKGDLISEESESFTLEITSADLARIQDKSKSTITIVDNDPLPKISFDTFTDEVLESAGTVNVLINLDRSASRSVKADLTLAGTAQRNTDYRITQPLSIEIPQGQTQYQLAISVLSDSVREGGETVILQLSNPTSAELGVHTLYSLVISSEVSINDTGITMFSDGINFDYAEPLEGFEGQDAGFGSDTIEDPESMLVVGLGINPKYNGRTSFNFTKLDSAGNPLPTSSSEWSCVRDNNTGLVFERKNENEYFVPVSEKSAENYLMTGNYRAKNFRYTWLKTDQTNNGGYSGWTLGKNGAALSTNAPTLSPYCGYQEGLFGRNHKLYCSTESYVQELNYKGLCGFKDWRMPETEELRSIVNYQKHESKNFTHPFDEGFFDCLTNADTILDCVSNNQSDEYYWTGTPAANNPDSAWCFSLTTSEFRLCHKAETHRILTVRSDY